MELFSYETDLETGSEEESTVKGCVRSIDGEWKYNEYGDDGVEDSCSSSENCICEATSAEPYETIATGSCEKSIASAEACEQMARDMSLSFELYTTVSYQYPVGCSRTGWGSTVRWVGNSTVAWASKIHLLYCVHPLIPTGVPTSAPTTAQPTATAQPTISTVGIGVLAARSMIERVHNRADRQMEVWQNDEFWWSNDRMLSEGEHQRREEVERYKRQLSERREKHG